MAYDPYRFVNPSFANAQNAAGAADVAGLQARQNSADYTDYKRDWWKRGLVDAAVNGVKGGAIGFMTGGPWGALAGAGAGIGTGFAQDALDKSKGYQGPGTSSVQASQLSGLAPIGAAALGKALGSGAPSVGRDAMQQSSAYTAEMNAAKAGLAPGMSEAAIPTLAGNSSMLGVDIAPGVLSDAAPLLEDATAAIPF